jgi:hypothetical protein
VPKAHTLRLADMFPPGFFDTPPAGTLADSQPACLLYLFDFWTETRSYVVAAVVAPDQYEEFEFEDNVKRPNAANLLTPAAHSTAALSGLGLVRFPAVPRHSASLYRLTAFTAGNRDAPQLLGGNLHFSCGMEVARMAELSPAAVTHDAAFDGTGSSSGSGGSKGRIRSVYLSFEAGALKPFAWGGAVYLFCPVDRGVIARKGLGHRTPLCEDVLTAADVRVRGPASEAGAREVVDYIDDEASGVCGVVVKVPVGCHIVEPSQAKELFVVVDWVCN